MICNLCPRRCAVDRVTALGVCGMGWTPKIARAALHFDEEPVISGRAGSGAVFFSGCNLKCAYCQNEKISRFGFGTEVTDLRAVYEDLIAQGAVNINLVTGTHFLPAILKSLEKPLPVPVVWNCSGYETPETLRALEGKVQIYLPDLKYVDSEGARAYSAAPDYPEVAKAALSEMLRQTGPVEIGGDGLMKRGTLVRHLILPGRVIQSKLALRWIARNLPGAWVSLMAQYMPCGRAKDMPPLDRRLYAWEYESVCAEMARIGIADGFTQELAAADEQYVPAFDLTGVGKENPSLE